MNINKMAQGLISGICVLMLSPSIAHSQQTNAPTTVQVHMVITNQTANDSSDVPVLGPQNVQVKQGKSILKLNRVIPAKADTAALQFFILIDDTVDSRIGANLNELRDFVNSQPASTLVGVGYMSNATFQITQNFTADHALVAKALRLPLGSLSAMDSPYLSLISLVKSWPQQNVRREVLMITDGLDRFRGRVPSRGYTMPSVSPDADTASQISQRYGVIVHSIYATGVGRHARNSWEAQLGQSGIALIADGTGGEYFALGMQNAVSFKPYLERLQRIFDNQYYLEFQAVPGKKDGLQRVDISTSMPNVDIASADNVWDSRNSEIRSSTGSGAGR